MIVIKQLNCGKRTPSMTLITHWRDCDVTLIQEPNRGSAKEMLRNGKYFKTLLSPSAIFFNSPNLDCTQIPQFCSKDITTIQIEQELNSSETSCDSQRKSFIAFYVQYINVSNLSILASTSQLNNFLVATLSLLN
jgi:hypothetical protein